MFTGCDGGGDGVVTGAEEGAVVCDVADGTRRPGVLAGVVKLDPTDPSEMSGRDPPDDCDKSLCTFSAADIAAIVVHSVRLR